MLGSVGLRFRTSVGARGGIAAAATIGSAVVIGSEVAVQPLVAATGVGAVTMIAVAAGAPQVLAACAPALTLLGPDALSGRLNLIVVAALLFATAVRSAVARSTLVHGSHLALGAFAAWLLLNYMVHFWGFSDSSPPDISPGADAVTLLLGVALAYAASLLDIPRRLLFQATGAAIAGVAVAVILYGSPGAIMLGLQRNSLALVMALGLAIAATDARRESLIFWTPATASMLWALMILQSRGGVVAAGFALALAACLRIRGGISLGRATVAALFIVAVVAAAVTAAPTLSQAAQFGRSESDLRGDTLARSGAAIVAIRATIANPVIGVGYGRLAIVAYQDPQFGDYLNAHNQFLQLSAELGLPGLGFFLAVLAASVKGLYRQRDYVAFALVATYLVGSLFINQLSNLPVSASFWICVGIGLKPLGNRDYLRSAPLSDAALVKEMSAAATTRSRSHQL